MDFNKNDIDYSFEIRSLYCVFAFQKERNKQERRRGNFGNAKLERKIINVLSW